MNLFRPVATGLESSIRIEDTEAASFANDLLPNVTFILARQIIQKFRNGRAVDTKRRFSATSRDLQHRVSGHDVSSRSRNTPGRYFPITRTVSRKLYSAPINVSLSEPRTFACTSRACIFCFPFYLLFAYNRSTF